MWIVRRCAYMDTDGQLVDEPFLLLNQFFRSNWDVRVSLYSTDTQDEVTFKASDGIMIANMLSQYSPYGCGALSEQDVFEDGYPTDGTYLFCAVDDLSWRFLNCVDSVTELILPLSGYDVCKEWTILSAVDKDKTLFSLELQKMHQFRLFCTLFQVMRYGKVTWSGDDAYLHSMWAGKVSVNNNKSLKRKTYRVRFCDSAEAKTLLAKAAFMNINPIADYREDLFMLR